MLGLMRLATVAGLLFALSLAGGCTSSPDPIDYGTRGVQVQKRADTARLEDTPQDFRDFIAGVAANLGGGSDTDCFVGVTVNVYDPAGFARGAVNDCGGYAAIWGKKDGRWKELLGTQMGWLCTDLKKNRVPTSVSKTCIKAGSFKELRYDGP